MKRLFFFLFIPALASSLRAAPAPVRPNLVIIGWDTLRADHVGALGYARNTTPNLDRFAAGAVLFTNAVSQASWTLPSFMSVFTGLYPSEHGMTNKYLLPGDGGSDLVEAALSTSVVTMAELLKANGYRTAAFTGGAGVGPSYGFGRGFDVYVGSRNFSGFASAFPPALDWVRRNGGAPFFLFVHGYDSHPLHELEPGAMTFVEPGETESALKLQARHGKLREELLNGKRPDHTPADVRLWTDAYDEKIARADRLLGDFLPKLEALASTDTIIVLLSDHGEELFDHGGIDHGMTLYDEMLRVPLIVKLPGRAGTKVGQQVRLIDVLPTVADLLGLKGAGGARWRGVSLAPLMDGGKKALDAFSETDYLFHFSARSIRKSGGLKLISDGITLRREMYDTAADPGEKKDLFAGEAARSYLLETELFFWQDRLGPFRPAPAHQ